MDLFGIIIILLLEGLERHKKGLLQYCEYTSIFTLKKLGHVLCPLAKTCNVKAGLPLSIPNADQWKAFRINAMILIGIDRHWELIDGVLYLGMYRQHCFKNFVFLD